MRHQHNFVGASMRNRSVVTLHSFPRVRMAAPFRFLCRLRRRCRRAAAAAAAQFKRLCLPVVGCLWVCAYSRLACWCWMWAENVDKGSNKTTVTANDAATDELTPLPTGHIIFVWLRDEGDGGECRAKRLEVAVWIRWAGWGKNMCLVKCGSLENNDGNS